MEQHEKIRKEQRKKILVESEQELVQHKAELDRAIAEYNSALSDLAPAGSLGSQLAGMKATFAKDSILDGENEMLGVDMENLVRPTILRNQTDLAEKVWRWSYAAASLSGMSFLSFYDTFQKALT